MHAWPKVSSTEPATLGASIKPASPWNNRISFLGCEVAVQGRPYRRVIRLNSIYKRRLPRRARGASCSSSPNGIPRGIEENGVSASEAAEAVEDTSSTPNAGNDWYD